MTNGEAANSAVPKEKIEIVYADTDTLSSFLNRNSFGYFMKVFEKMEADIIISKTVFLELCSGEHKEIRKSTIEQLQRGGRITIIDIDPFSNEGDTYFNLSAVMGAGEASALALAKHSDKYAVVASNNLSDVAAYAKKNGIELWPTARIMQEAIDLKIMNMNQADILWKNMKADGIKLPSYETFEEYYKDKK